MPWRGWRWAAHSQPVEVAPIPGVDAAMWRSVFFTGIPPFTTSLVESGSFFEGMECAQADVNKGLTTQFNPTNNPGKRLTRGG